MLSSRQKSLLKFIYRRKKTELVLTRSLINKIIKLNARGPTSHEKPKQVSTFQNPLINLKKKIDSLKVVLFARHPSSNTVEPSESWQLEPSVTQLVRANKTYKPANDLMYADAQVT